MIDSILLVDDEDLFHLVFEDACSLLDISLSLNALNSSDEAAKKFDLNMADSVMIGDNETDMVAAQRAGIQHRILIGSAGVSTVASDLASDHQQCIEILRKIVMGNQEKH